MRKVTFALVTSGVLVSVFLMLNQFFSNASFPVSGADYRGGSSCFSPVSFKFCPMGGGGCASRRCGDDNHCSPYSQSKRLYSQAITETTIVENGGFARFLRYSLPCYVMEDCGKCIRSGNQSYCTVRSYSGPEPEGGVLVDPCIAESEE